MANLKNIVDLPVAESAEGLNLIVNDNGAAKQIAAHEVGAQADFAVTDENSPAFIKNKPAVVKSVNGAQPDENGNVQIDTVSSWNDLKDKPFYAEMEVVLEKQVIEGFEVFEGINGQFLAEYPCELNIFLGEKLSVWFDGENYECTTINLPDAPVEIFGFGNPAFVGGPEGPEPFFIVYIGPEKFMQIGTGNPGTSHEIGISKEVAHKLEARYLPNSVWTEEETHIVVDKVVLEDRGVGCQSAFTYPFIINESDTITVVLDGDTYPVLPQNIYYNDEDEYYFFDVWNEYEDQLLMVSNYQRDTDNWIISTHGDSPLVSIIVTRTTVLTNCDLAVEIEEHEDAGLSRVVRGTFDAAAAKIGRGLPVSVYAHGTMDWIQSGYTQADFIAEIATCVMARRDGEYALSFNAGGRVFYINRDGSLGTD